MQELADHGVLASVGSVGDAYDNALAESFVDSFKTELIDDRVWRSRSQPELAVVEYLGWFNHDRLHEALGDIPPAEFEQRHAAKAAISGNGSIAMISPKPADRVYAARLERERASQPETAVSAITVQVSPAVPARIPSVKSQETLAENVPLAVETCNGDPVSGLSSGGCGGVFRRRGRGGRESSGWG